MQFYWEQFPRFSIRVGFVATLTVLAGCASGPPAPVVDLSIGGSSRASTTDNSVANPQVQTHDTYRVVAGDTLYSIAFRRGLDYRELAKWNAIASPYRIGVGQLLRLQPAQTAQNAQPEPGLAITEAAPERAVAATVTPLTVTTLPASATRSTVAASGESVIASDPVSPPNVPATPVNSVVQAPPDEAVVAPPPAPQPAAKVAELNVGGVTWRWPSDGKVINTYVDGDQTRQGLDIAGKAGDPVRAAAAGEVVYSGNGLIGYGELIIVKHNSSFLSAYAHNRKRLVKEGEHVIAGQQIAQMGSTASSRDELHFEIRKNGKPVNPLDYLPAH